MMRPELCPPRIISAPTGASVASFRPWVEVTALVRVSVAAWALAEESWMHWAVPVLEGRADLDGAVPFDPGRRAATQGEPPVGLRRWEAAIDQPAADRLCEELFARWRPRVHHHPVLRLSSRLDEPLDAFRTWCAGLVGQALRRRQASSRALREADPLAIPVESRTLVPNELEVLRWRVGVGWYPEGVEPGPAPRDALMNSAAGLGP